MSVMNCIEEIQGYVALLTTVLVFLNYALIYYTVSSATFQAAIPIFFGLPVSVTLLALLIAFSLPKCSFKG
ncbi:hypothetical protein IPA_00120 [Ignicoccus pacificus DSM 13166]|uniref:Uncharacterized protein n=1 Tax=Ignicoccus pacificus DSM 13166 TaxID=940294 RepID=A0A977KA98_9CREN|nr:hypothetical protein IPA_00120 [Ignicoccus pacificus DSM 13166]